MRLTSKPLAAIVVVLMFGGIFFSNLLGWWETESTKEAAVYTEGEFAGQANPADIRGSYTFGDVEANFGVPAALMAQAFGVQTDDPTAFPVKDLEATYAESAQEVGTASVRLFVAFYLGLPIDLSTDIYLPGAAAVILRTRELSAEYAAYLETHVLSEAAVEPAQQPVETVQSPSPPEILPTEAIPQSTPEHTPVGTGEGTGDGSGNLPGTIKGKTTFAELIEWGLDVETIELVLGMPMPAATGMTVKDFCVQNGLSFETIKPALQAELDKLP